MQGESASATGVDLRLIEFVGVQGSGKTTLSQVVRSQLIMHGWVVNTKADLQSRGFLRHLALLAFVLCRPRVVVEALKYLGTLRPRRFSRVASQVRRAFDLHVIHRRGGLWILDEGMVHRMFLDAIRHAGVATERQESLIRESYRRIMPNVMFILVEADEATLIQRLREPSHSHCIFNRVPPEEIDALISTSVAQVENLFHIAVRVLNAAGMNINGVDRPNDEAGRVVKFILAEASSVVSDSA